MNAEVTKYINSELGVVEWEQSFLDEIPESQYSYERIKALKLKIQRERDKNVHKLQKAVNRNISLLEKGIIGTL